MRVIFKLLKRISLSRRLTFALCCTRTQTYLKIEDQNLKRRFLFPQNHNTLHFSVPKYFQKAFSKTWSYSDNKVASRLNPVPLIRICWLTNGLMMWAFYDNLGHLLWQLVSSSDCELANLCFCYYYSPVASGQPNVEGLGEPLNRYLSYCKCNKNTAFHTLSLHFSPLFCAFLSV